VAVATVAVAEATVAAVLNASEEDIRLTAAAAAAAADGPAVVVARIKSSTWTLHL